MVEEGVATKTLDAEAAERLSKTSFSMAAEFNGLQFIVMQEALRGEVSSEAASANVHAQLVPLARSYAEAMRVAGETYAEEAFAAVNRGRREPVPPEEFLESLSKERLKSGIEFAGSAAAPLAAYLADGVVAGVRAKYPEVSPEAVQSFLKEIAPSMSADRHLPEDFSLREAFKEAYGEVRFRNPEVLAVVPDNDFGREFKQYLEAEFAIRSPQNQGVADSERRPRELEPGS